MATTDNYKHLAALKTAIIFCLSFACAALVSCASSPKNEKSSVAEADEFLRDPKYTSLKLFEQRVFVLDDKQKQWTAENPRQEKFNFILLPVAGKKDSWRLKSISLFSMYRNYVESAGLSDQVLSSYLQFLEDENILQIEQSFENQVYHVRILDQSYIDQYKQVERYELDMYRNNVLDLTKKGTHRQDYSIRHRITDDVIEENYLDTIWLSVPIYEHVPPYYVTGSINELPFNDECERGREQYHLTYLKPIKAVTPLAQKFLGDRDKVKYEECAYFFLDEAAHYGGSSAYMPSLRRIIDFPKGK